MLKVISGYHSLLLKLSSNARKILSKRPPPLPPWGSNLLKLGCHGGQDSEYSNGGSCLPQSHEEDPEALMSHSRVGVCFHLWRDYRDWFRRVGGKEFEFCVDVYSVASGDLTTAGEAGELREERIWLLY